MVDFSVLDQFPYYRQSGAVKGAQDFPYLWVTAAFTTLVFLVETWLDYRQLFRFSNSPVIPEQLKEHVQQDTFDKAIAYRKDKFSFHIVEMYFGFFLGLITMFGGYLPYMWDKSDEITLLLVKTLGYTTISNFYQEAITTWVFVTLYSLLDTIISLPFSIISTFVIEERHGFNKSTLSLFFQDKLMMIALQAGISFPVLSIVIYLVRIGGEYFYFYVWFFLCIVSIILMTVYPTWIAPLFNKYTKLEAGEVKTAIEDLARQVQFPLTNIFSVDGSRRSAHSNAYFYGFFKSKRIVLYDTLLKQVTLEELLAILGHEIGHWKLWHTIQGFFITQCYTLSLFLSFSFVQNTPDLFESFGFHFTSATTMPVFIGLMLFSQTFWGPVDKVLTLALTFNSRLNEFAADAFAVELGKGPALASGLIKISIENLDNLVPDKLYSLYHYSHPPLVERLGAINDLQKKR